MQLMLMTLRHSVLKLANSTIPLSASSENWYVILRHVMSCVVVYQILVYLLKWNMNSVNSLSDCSLLYETINAGV